MIYADTYVRYSNTLLAVFNNRIFIKNRVNGSSGGYPTRDSTIAFQLATVSTGSVIPSRISKLTGSAAKRDAGIGKFMPDSDVSDCDVDMSFSREVDMNHLVLPSKTMLF